MTDALLFLFPDKAVHSRNFGDGQFHSEFYFYNEVEFHLF